MKLLILDFSGTLSLDAVLFGRKERLAAELEKSGIADLGAGDPEVFWKEIILPGWEEGSLTEKGYAAVLSACLCAFTQKNGIAATEPAIHAAARAFSAAYFAASPIEEAWKIPLTRLAADQDVFVLIATDHYAEVVPHISGCLERWGINAVPAPSMENAIGGFRIAASAALGAYKADAVFWRAAKADLEKSQPRRAFTSIRLVDDFGCNENAASEYGGKSRVRREKTAAAIEEVFGLSPEVFSFFLEPEILSAAGLPLRRAYAALVREAAAFLVV